MYAKFVRKNCLYAKNPCDLRGQSQEKKEEKDKAAFSYRKARIIRHIRNRNVYDQRKLTNSNVCRKMKAAMLHQKKKYTNKGLWLQM
ncbi:MAG: hypothetical protein EAZ92_07835 [Candidatus Kapaibacterium sp.]|nr:MAG: hypothetical protein EAZ92_07835 [Candidatus Kapabacteria bacterium]